MVTYKLEHPFEYDGNRIESLTLNRPKGKHLKNFSSNPTTADMIVLAAKISGQPTTVFDEMDAVDVIGIAEVIGGFLDRGQKTGAN